MLASESDSHSGDKTDIHSYLQSIVDDVNARDPLVTALGGNDFLLKYYVQNCINGTTQLNHQQLQNIKALQNNTHSPPSLLPEEDDDDAVYYRQMKDDPYYQALHNNHDPKQQVSFTKNSLNLLTYGYIRDSFKTLSISQTMPSALYEIIYNYFKSRTICITMLGHVDCGKSTLLGKLLRDSGMVSDEKMEKLRTYATQTGKASFQFAFICDKLKEERARGITIAGSTHAFNTESNQYFIFDVAGHRDFIKNISTNIAMSDVGILVVSAAVGGFETSVLLRNHRRYEISGAVYLHAQKCFSLGIQQLIVCINKLDSAGIVMKQRYIECKKEVESILITIGYKPQNILFIPISAWRGWNVRHKDTVCDFEGFQVEGNIAGKPMKGYTLYDALEYFAHAPVLNATQARQVSGGGIVSISKMFGFYKKKEKGLNDYFEGKVEKGSIRVGQKVEFYPKSKAKARIKSIGINHSNDIIYAQYGDIVGIRLDGLTKKIDRNDIMVTVPEVHEKDTLYPLISKKIQCFNATVFVMHHPGKLKCGYAPLIYVGTRRAACVMTKINWKMDVRKKEDVMIWDPAFIEAKDKANIELTSPVDHPLIVMTSSDFYKYAVINVHQSGEMVMCGYVTHVQYEDGY